MGSALPFLGVTLALLKGSLGILLDPSLQVNQMIKLSLFGEQVTGVWLTGQMGIGQNQYVFSS